MTACALTGRESIIFLHSFLSLLISIHAVVMAALSSLTLLVLLEATFCFKMAQTFSIGQKSAILGACISEVKLKSVYFQNLFILKYLLKPGKFKFTPLLMLFSITFELIIVEMIY